MLELMLRCLIVVILIILETILLLPIALFLLMLEGSKIGDGLEFLWNFIGNIFNRIIIKVFPELKSII